MIADTIDRRKRNADLIDNRQDLEKPDATNFDYIRICLSLADTLIFHFYVLLKQQKTNFKVIQN